MLRPATEEEIEIITRGSQPSFVKLREVSQPSSVDNKTKNKKSVSEKVSTGLGAVFGGKTIGTAIGTQLSKMSPSARALKRSESLGQVPQGAYEGTFQSPSAKSIGGDILATGLGLVGMKGIGPIAKGASTLSRLGNVGKITALGSGIGAGRAMEEGGDIGRGALTGGLVSSAFPAVGGALKLGGIVSGRLGRGLAGALSGRKMQVIDEIINNPEQALVGLRSNSGELLKKNASAVRKIISEKSRQASQEFGEALEQLPKRLGRPSELKSGQPTSISIGGDIKKLNILGVKQKLTKTLRDFGVEVNPKKLEFDFLESPFDDMESKRLREVFNVVREWKNTTPKGLHMLSRKIRNFRKPGEQSPELNSVIDKMSKSVHEYLGEKVPQSKEMLRKFTQAQDIIDAFDQELGTKGSFTGGTSERIKTGKKLAGIFSGEKTEAQDLIRKELPDLLPQEAGRQMVTSEAGIGAGSPGIVRNEFIRAITSAVVTPKQIGEILVKVGQTKESAQKISEAISSLSPSVRNILVRLISGL